jgi:hypothetical protein
MSKEFLTGAQIPRPFFWWWCRQRGWCPQRRSITPGSRTRTTGGARPRQLILDTAAWMLLDDAGEVSSLEDVQRAL